MTTTHAARITLGESGSENEVLSITVLDAATIFEGPETVYRYDLPGTGIVDGWALNNVIDQCAKLCGPDWPEVEAVVIADSSGTEVSHEAVDIVRRQLAAVGVQVLSTEEPEAHGGADVSADASAAAEVHGLAGDRPEEPRTRAGRRAGSTPKDKKRRAGLAGLPQLRLPGGIDPFYLLIAAVVLGVAVVAWWAVGKKDAAEAEMNASTVTATSAQHSAAAQPDAPAGDSGAAGAYGAKAGQKSIDVEGMNVVLPQGFQTAVKDGLVTATGEDPQLRILLAADPLYNVPIEALFTEIKAQVEEDPALKDVTEESGRLRYTEEPGDGSVVTWITWEDKGHQMSVGCHTQHQPNVVHKAACRMAAESLVKK
ncbi:type VII secretion-associated protein [Corynebacterium sp.]|uniref:type VII secretion-associated protein n=1 Tax=Corynebacterium sp. TaxID=1720 RepID=UPI0026DC68E9|nr:type VII secretion-associated protein [Corynebacterium sp.]MDO5031273.1 type VII secretion-associated protein [Corynebacterium sp.]